MQAASLHKFALPSDFSFSLSVCLVWIVLRILGGTLGGELPPVSSTVSFISDAISTVSKVYTESSLLLWKSERVLHNYQGNSSNE